MSQAADYIPVAKVRRIQQQLARDGKLRDALLWTAGPNWALRISDLLSVKVGDVMNGRGIKPAFTIKQRKTGKTVTCHNTTKVAAAIEAYLKHGHPKPEDPKAPLFPSLQRDRQTGALRALSRVQAWNLIKRDTEAAGLVDGIYSPHSWRKTWGRAALERNVPMAVVQEKLGHRTPGSLLNYLGVTRDDVRKASEDIEV